MQDSALYYPHINFNDESLVKTMAMFYDNIYRIVPNDYIPEDSSELQSILEDRRIGRPIDPSRYTKHVSQEFLDKVDNWNAAGLIPDNEDDEIILDRIHSDKTDAAVKHLFDDLGFKKSSDWYHIPQGLASNYMLYLSKHIAEKNNLQLVTPDSNAFTATTYFRIDGGADDGLIPYEEHLKYMYDSFALYSFAINRLTPENISEIPAHKIIQFREKRKDEIENFRNSIYTLQQELQVLDDEFVIADKINSAIKDFKKAQEDYHNSADMFKVTGWRGFWFMGIPAAVSMGSVFSSLPLIATGAFSGMFLSGLYNISTTKEKLEELKNKKSISYLMNVNNLYYSHQREGYKLYDKMHEYAND